MSHFESVLERKLPEQGAFSIQGQVNVARQHFQHKIIDEAVEIAEQCNGLIDRRGLLKVWQNDSISLGAKIVLTNWWGGISHFNRPKFYTGKNMEILSGLPRDLFHGLNIDHERIVQSFLPNGELHLQGVGMSFFTKYLQFSSQSSKLEPFIIADKWTLLAVIADHFSRETDAEYLKINSRNRTVSFRELNATSYLSFNEYFVGRARELEISPFQLEERVFGWRGSKDRINNPRHIGMARIF